MSRYKTKLKQATKALSWMLILVLCLNAAFALGIRPVKSEAGSSLTYSGAFKVVNNDGKDLKVRIYVEGDLAEFIEVSEQELEFSSSEGMKEVHFSLNIPDRALPPGLNEGRIIVEEMLYTSATKDGYVTANIKMAHKVYVDVPKPDKYIEAKIDVVEENKDVGLIATLKNTGTENLDNVESTLSVYSGETEIESHKDIAKEIDVNSEHSFSSYVEKEKLGNGEFKVLATVNYAEYTLELIEAFIIGKPVIKLLNYDKYFLENQINELGLDLKNDWNTEITDINAEVFVFKNSKEAYNTKTTSFDLEPYEETKITTYFDTRNLETGEYSMNVVLNYLNYSLVETYEAYVLNEEDYKKKLGPSTLTYILIAVIVLTVAVIALLSYLIFGMKKNGKRHKGKV